MTEVLTQAGASQELFAAHRERLAGSEPEWLTARRDRAIAFFRESGFPTRRHEDWKYTDLKPVAETAFQLATSESALSPDELTRFEYEGLDAHRFVFVNGVFQPALSQLDALPKGVRVSTMAEALQADSDEIVRKHFGAKARLEDHPFSALNAALFQDGFFLHVEANVVVEKPFHLVFVTTETADPTMANLHNLIVLEQSAEATVIETHGTTGHHRYFKNVVTEIDTAPNAHLDRYVLQRESVEGGWLVSSDYLRQDRDSTVRSHTFDFGGALVRHNSWARLEGKACEAIVNGLYVLRGSQHVDNYMWVEHVEENIPSHELYKGILDQNATAAFTGRIYVHREAQKTDAKQTNQNLLLSDTARANTRPQLEIYADDVKCTHGATIGQLDPQAQFYLESRGVKREEARNLLVHAFASELIECIRIEPLRQRTEQLLDERLRERG